MLFLRNFESERLSTKVRKEEFCKQKTEMNNKIAYN